MAATTGKGKDTAAGASHGLRFEATIQQGDRERAFARVADLDLDRVPDPTGDVRLLIDADELALLLEEGYEVRLHRTVRPEPLVPGLLPQPDGDAAEDQHRLELVHQEVEQVPEW